MGQEGGRSVVANGVLSAHLAPAAAWGQDIPGGFLILAELSLNFLSSGSDDEEDGNNSTYLWGCGEG